jgi:hypothetical protein
MAWWQHSAMVVLEACASQQLLVVGKAGKRRTGVRRWDGWEQSRRDGDAHGKKGLASPFGQGNEGIRVSAGTCSVAKLNMAEMVGAAVETMSGISGFSLAGTRRESDAVAVG